MARNKVSNFSADEGLFDKFKNVQDVQEVQETQQVQEVKPLKIEEPKKEIGTTQGKKGQKLKRINMAFSDVNHEFIIKESRKNGISATAFVNSILDAYRNQN